MPASKSPQAIDTHAHVFSATAPAVPGARYRPAYAATLDGWRSRWESAGITRGVRAMRLNLKGVEDYEGFAAPPWRALYERAHVAGWHVEIFIDAGRLPEVAHMFEGIPVPLVFDHFGNPGRGDRALDATFTAVRELAASRAVWCKLSAPYRLEGWEPHALVVRWLDAVGPQRVVWGSDWPGTGFEATHDYAKMRAALDDWIGGHRAHAALWDNAARLYQFA